MTSTWEAGPGSPGPRTRWSAGNRPVDGLSAATPQNWAGTRSDPPESLPSPSAAMPVATATASPPLVPPGVRPRSHGLTVSPYSSLRVCMPARISVGMLACPIGMAPAARSRATGGASAGATRSRKRGTPNVVAVPATGVVSFTVNGTPASGPSASPAARRRSMRAASARACSAISCVTAFTCGLTSAIRSRWLSTSSPAETSARRTASACAEADSFQRCSRRETMRRSFRSVRAQPSL